MRSEIDRAGLFEAAEYPAGDVVHLVGRVTDSVFSFLGPVTAALAARGMRQTVVLIDDPACRHVLPKFDASVRLVLTRCHANWSARIVELLQAFVGVARARKPAIAHLHGINPLLVGFYATHFRGVATRTVFSPHGSRLLAPLRSMAASLLPARRLGARHDQQRAIASTRIDGTSLRKITRQPVDVIESPVGPVFFSTALQPSEEPLVVTSRRSANLAPAAQFAQCAVLFAHQLPGLRFEWIGRVDDAAGALLKAAAVSSVQLHDDKRRALRLASAWVYLALDDTHGFPVFLAEAMALGLPCIVSDTPYHRDLVEDGENGFVCGDETALLSRLLELIGSESMRHRIGRAARASAMDRFDSTLFGDSLFDAYGASSTSRLRG